MFKAIIKLPLIQIKNQKKIVKAKIIIKIIIIVIIINLRKNFMKMMINKQEMKNQKIKLINPMRSKCMKRKKV